MNREQKENRILLLSGDTNQRITIMAKRINHILDLIREINGGKVHHKKSNETGYPKVGIFYVIDGKLVPDTTPTKEADDYGDFKTHVTPHYKFWALLKRFVFPKYKDLDYDYFPRGRVVYKKVEDRYSIYLDKCVMKDKKMVAQIKKEFNLPYNKCKVLVGFDYHYQCKKCNPKYVE